MNISELIHKIRLISALKNEIAPPKILLDRVLTDAEISMDPECTAPYPSTSSNLVRFMGTETPLSSADAMALVDRYQSHGIKRFFVFMSPSPWLEENLNSLAAAGLTPFIGPAYHTLVHSLSELTTQAPPCYFRIQRLTESSDCDSLLFERGASKAVIRPEFDVWAAMNSRSVAGYGMATTLEGITYLGGAATAEPYRNHGVQSAIIHARLQDAVRRGSEIAVSETLSMLGSSLRNLQRAGFTIVYDKIVYQYSAK